jgi:hypothetical protein
VYCTWKYDLLQKMGENRLLPFFYFRAFLLSLFCKEGMKGDFLSFLCKGRSGWICTPLVSHFIKGKVTQNSSCPFFFSLFFFLALRASVKGLTFSHLVLDGALSSSHQHPIGSYPLPTSSKNRLCKRITLVPISFHKI